ncbi:MAG: M20/M25/M40 family metallo-hydrolase [Dehalococcoidia bacterium]|nr:M20/M25/M40 family metallo-hydrolase [Dehalococcoidia bacterium]
MSALLILLLALSIACTTDSRSSLPSTAATEESSASSTGANSPSPNLDGKTSGSHGTAAGTASLPDVGPAEPSGARAYEHVKALAVDIGSRPTGTDGERRAAEYISSQFKNYGYSVSLQEFSFASFRDKGSSLEVISPAQGQFAPKTMVNSGAGDVPGVLEYGGLGRNEDLAPLDLKGKIVLLERGQITFQQKVDNVTAKGAIAAVVYNNQDGDLQGSLQSLSAIPVVSLSRDQGQNLKGMLAQGSVNVKVHVDTGPPEVHSQNVVAVPDKPCTVIVGGHYDSVDAGPGANDNGSGTADVIEISRAARDLSFKTGVCFVAFGGEELGLWGSRRYVEGLSPADKARLKGMINLDMVSVGDSWKAIGSDSLVNLAVQAGKDSQIEMQPFTMSRQNGSDHGSFISAGIPAVFLYRSDDPNYHTAEDKAEYVDPNALEQAAKVAMGVIEALIESSASR